jgi:hypothetical protein
VPYFSFLKEYFVILFIIIIKYLPLLIILGTANNFDSIYVYIYVLHTILHVCYSTTLILILLSVELIAILNHVGNDMLQKANNDDAISEQ